MKPDWTADEIRAQLHQSIAGREEADFVLAAQRVQRVPLWLMRWAGQRAARQYHSRDRYVCTATVSNLGFVDAQNFSGDGFEGQRVFFIPPGGLSVPLFLTLTGGREGLELCGAVPGVRSTQADLAAYLKRIGEKISALLDPGP